MTGESFWTPERFRALTQGRWIHRPVAPEAIAPNSSLSSSPALSQAPPSPNRAETPPVILGGVCTDTRAIERGAAFFALRGERHDGHNYLDDAARAGAALLVVEKAARVDPAAREWPASLYALEVASTRIALAQLATGYRRTLSGTRVIAITGSSGKTTTKRMVSTILSQYLRGSASPKSFNNDIGVPLTILAARPGDHYLIVEIGSNSPGEIGALASIAAPDIAVITSVGRSHLERLESVEGVAREKVSLLSSLEADGFAIVNADSAELRRLIPPAPHVVTFGFAEDADLRITSVESRADGVQFTLNRRRAWSVPLHGRHQASNAAAAIAVARRLGLTDERIQAGFELVTPDEMRFSRAAIGDWRIYNDTYNANPESMLAAIETFLELEIGDEPEHAGRPAPRDSQRVLILGDMLELGAHTGAAHREVVERIVDLVSRGDVQQVLLVGGAMRQALDELDTCDAAFRDRFLTIESLDGRAGAELDQLIADTTRGFDCGPGAILLKASRGVGLERLIAAIERAANRC